MCRLFSIDNHWQTPFPSAWPFSTGTYTTQAIKHYDDYSEFFLFLFFSFFFLLLTFRFSSNNWLLFFCSMLYMIIIMSCDEITKSYPNTCTDAHRFLFKDITFHLTVSKMMSTRYAWVSICSISFIVCMNMIAIHPCKRTFMHWFIYQYYLTLGELCAEIFRFSFTLFFFFFFFVLLNIARTTWNHNWKFYLKKRI